jgi:hypothetical protein
LRGAARGGADFGGSDAPGDPEEEPEEAAAPGGDGGAEAGGEEAAAAAARRLRRRRRPRDGGGGGSGGAGGGVLTLGALKREAALFSAAAALAETLPGLQVRIACELHCIGGARCRALARVPQGVDASPGYERGGHWCAKAAAWPAARLRLSAPQRAPP